MHDEHEAARPAPLEWGPDDPIMQADVEAWDTHIRLMYDPAHRAVCPRCQAADRERDWRAKLSAWGGEPL